MTSYHQAPTVHFIFSSFDKLCTHGAFICVCVCVVVVQLGYCMWMPKLGGIHLTNVNLLW